VAVAHTAVAHRLPLLVRSAYAFLRGVVPPDRWARAARETGYGTLALVDWAGLYGVLPFLEATEREGLRPIIGAEIPMRPRGAGCGPTRASGRRGRLIALCEDLSGYRNLGYILSRWHGAANGAQGGVPGDAEDPVGIVAAEADGLLLLSDDDAVLARLRRELDSSALAALLPWPPSPRGERLKREAARLDVEVVALPQAVLIDESERETLRLLEAIRRGGMMAEQRGHGSLMPRPAELAVRLETEPGAHRAGRRLLERCHLRRSDLTTRTFIFPRLAGAEGSEVLRRRCLEGLDARGLRTSARARQRLEQELAVIEQLGFVDYFLATARIVDWARAQGIPTIGRGSGVASLVAYLLFITNVDPLSYGLYFERFLHPLRGDYPDLDIDLAWDRRDDVIRHALAAFGPDRAARVGTHHCFRERGAFREAGRALGLGEEALTRATRARVSLEDDPDATIARAAHLAARLVDLPRGLGLHPGGIVLADRPIGRIVAVERAANGDVVTQFEMHGVEAIGLIKIDLLGNRALGTEDETLRIIRATAIAAAATATAATQLVPAPPDMDRIRHDDARTARLLETADTLGCLQLESPAMRSLLRQLGSRDLIGAIHALSLVRPGPSSSGMKQAYIRRARGEEAPRAIHPALEGVLRETRGVPLYEEDVMCVAAAIGGLTLAEADMLRRAISQAIARAGRARAGDGEPAGAGGELAKLRDGFLAAARRQGKLDAAEAAWDVLVRFASYAFCKAHAAGYGVLAYRTAYLKANFPGPFFAALLNNHRGMYPARVYVDDARRRGLAARPPCVQRGDVRWRWEPPPGRGSGSGPGVLRCGLANVFGLHEETLRGILDERERGPFRSLGDFVARVRPSSAELEALLLAGAFDDAFGASRGALVWQAERLLRVWPRARRGAAASRMHLAQPALALNPPGGGLAPDDAAGGPVAGDVPDATEAAAGPWREISPAHRARLERRFLGISLSAHPLDLLPDASGGVTILAALEVASRGRSRDVELCGIVSAARRHRSDDGQAFFFFTLDDPTGLLECVVRGEAAVRDMPRVAIDHYVRVEGNLRNAHGAWSLAVHRVRVIGEH
jgi:DNA-directed DNA polymerase III PolC